MCKRLYNSDLELNNNRGNILKIDNDNKIGKKND